MLNLQGCHYCRNLHCLFHSSMSVLHFHCHPAKVNPIHIYENQGTYEVTLRVTDDEGANDETSKTLTILNRPPIASFNYTPPSPTIFDVISFTDTSKDPYGLITSYFWDFGDGSNATSKNTSHTFDQKGNHTIKLTVTDNDGAQSSISELIVVANLPPEANFECASVNTYINSDIQFNDKSVDPENMILSWFWDFGDGFTSDLQNPMHRFTSIGDYNVTLTVLDDEEVVDASSRVISIINPPPADVIIPIPLWMVGLIIVIILALSIFGIIWNRRRHSVTR